jgi:endonuclease/exonuclease/phosphatase family metal-dependent hydrolase
VTLLRVLTLNVGSLLEPHWEARRHEVVAWLDRLNPDIVCFQELWQSASAPNTLDWILSHQPAGRWHHVFGGYWPNWWPSDTTLEFGSAVLSRWPIDHHELVPLPIDPSPAESHDAWRTQFELLHARTAGIDVFSTHLAPAPAQAYHRVRQVVFVDKTVRRLSDPAALMPPVVCGDFNAEPQSDEIRFLSALHVVDGRSVFYQEAWQAAGRTDPGYTHDWRNNEMAAPFNVHPKRLDYIFVGDPFIRERGAGLVLHADLAAHEALTGIHASDHFGVVADIRWPTRPQSP